MLLSMTAKRSPSAATDGEAHGMANASLKPDGRGLLPCKDSVSADADTEKISASWRMFIPVCCRMESDKRLGVGIF